VSIAGDVFSLLFELERRRDILFAGARERDTGVKVERPQRSEDERP
jgi:hypothetical protein